MLSASSSMRVIASSRAWYMACVSVSSSMLWFMRRLLPADMVDAGADDQAERVEPGFLDQQKLVHRQVAGKQPFLVRAGPHGGEAVAGMDGQALLRAGGVGVWHDDSLLTDCIVGGGAPDVVVPEMDGTKFLAICSSPLRSSWRANLPPSEIHKNAEDASVEPSDPTVRPRIRRMPKSSRAWWVKFRFHDRSRTRPGLLSTLSKP